MSARHPRPNIRKAKLQRFQTPFDGWSDAEIAEFRAVLYQKVTPADIERRLEICNVLADLVLDLHLRGKKRVASQALKMAKTLTERWKVGILVKPVQKGRFAQDVLKDFEWRASAFFKLTQRAYPESWKNIDVTKPVAWPQMQPLIPFKDKMKEY